MVNLPNRSQFGSIDPILSGSYHVEYFFGEAMYLMTAANDWQCASLVRDGRYYGVLGNLAGGGQAYYAGNIEIHENSLSQPIADGGAALNTGARPVCPVPAKSFLNSECEFPI